MDTIRKADGFQNEYLFVFPDEWMRMVEAHELFSHFLVTDIGYFPKARHHYRERPEGCDTTILLYCRDGKGSICLDGGENVWTVEAGQAVLIPPRVPHWYSASGEDPWSVYWVHLGGALALPCLNLTGQGAPLHILPQFGGDVLREFYRCFEILKEPYGVEEYFLVCQSVGSILALLAVAVKQARQQLPKDGGRAIENCIRFMKANLSQPLSLERLATASGFSASHLHMLFKHSTGHSPVEYFLRMKMQAASKDLYFSDRLVKEIAMSYGIGDPYYFSRLFKKVMGLSPTVYRKQVMG